MPRIESELQQNQAVGDRVPPGQVVTDKFPVMTLGIRPVITTEHWELRVMGLVKQELHLSWEQLMRLPRMSVTADFHCVTHWSRFDNDWEGVPAREVLALAGPTSEARFAMLHCYDGYTTNLELEVLLQEEVLFAYLHGGRPIDRDHGAPLRLVVPSRYGWKSAKWVHAVELMADDRAGYWETLGYHMRGDPWKEERFRAG